MKTLLKILFWVLYPLFNIVFAILYFSVNQGKGLFNLMYYFNIVLYCFIIAVIMNAADYVCNYINKIN